MTKGRIHASLAPARRVESISAEGTAFLKEKEAEEGVIKLPSGLLYKAHGAAFPCGHAWFGLPTLHSPNHGRGGYCADDFFPHVPTPDQIPKNRNYTAGAEDWHRHAPSHEVDGLRVSLQWNALRLTKALKVWNAVC